MYIYIYIYVVLCMYVYIYIYIYIYILLNVYWPPLPRPTTRRPPIRASGCLCSAEKVAGLRGKHWSNTTCITQVFLKSGEEGN